MEQKDVKVVGEKMMIPADQLKVPDELCKKNNERVSAKFDPEEKDKEETQSDSQLVMDGSGDASLNKRVQGEEGKDGVLQESSM